MKRKRLKIVEKAFGVVLFSSSTVTSLTVLFIIVFLFTEGIGLFTSSPIEKKYKFIVSNNNSVKELTSKQLKDVFNYDITNWKQLGGKDDSIILFTINDLSTYFTDEELGANFENLPSKINELIKTNPGILAYLSDKYVPKQLQGHVVPLSNISIKDFVTGKEWYPTSEPAPQFGVLPLILGTIWVSIGAILIALPLGLATAIFMAEVASQRLRNILKPIIELLAGIPSVVYGFFGLVVLVPLIQQLFNLPVGETALAGSIILGIMALPTIITVSEDALRTTPRSLKEASLALGATRWQTITRVTVPYARSGITAASILGIGRAVGETMAVLMVTGNAGVIPHSFLQPVRTIPATIAAELGEAPYGGLHFKALFALGILLFIITFIINTSVELIKTRKQS
ncbi:MAG: phosphate ABC transporter permease subunit PstC [Bacteroidota bacterium]